MLFLNTPIAIKTGLKDITEGTQLYNEHRVKKVKDFLGVPHCG
jgi:hypothetical protein